MKNEKKVKDYDQKDEEINKMIEKREIANQALKKLLKGIESGKIQE